MNIKKILSLLLAVILILCVGSGCTTKENYDNYSHGLTNDGIYQDLDKHSIQLPNYQLNLTHDDVLEWGLSLMVESGYEEIKTIDDYVYTYAEEFLYGMGVTGKEVVAEGDIVSVSLDFYLDGKQLKDFVTTADYKASVEGDSIVNSFIGHKVKDEYEVQYTFPSDDKDYAGKTATVKVVINNVVSGSPIKDGMVESNLEKIDEYLDGVVDVDTFLSALRPKLAESILMDYMKTWLNEYEWEVPEEFVEYEVYRLKARLQKIGYTYQDYLNETQMTDEECREYCELLAKENVFTMMVYQTMDMKISDSDIVSYYGENATYLVQAQGAPYLRLTLIRRVAWSKVVSDIKFQDNDATTS